MEKGYDEIITFITTHPGVLLYFILIVFGLLAMLYLAVSNTPYYAVGGGL
jgi:hypothetical protein